MIVGNDALLCERLTKGLDMGRRISDGPDDFRLMRRGAGGLL